MSLACCPNCQQSLSDDSQFASPEVICPHCHERFVVPAAQADGDRPMRCQRCGGPIAKGIIAQGSGPSKLISLVLLVVGVITFFESAIFSLLLCVVAVFVFSPPTRVWRCLERGYHCQRH